MRAETVEVLISEMGRLQDWLLLSLGVLCRTEDTCSLSHHDAVLRRSLLVAARCISQCIATGHNWARRKSEAVSKERAALKASNGSQGTGRVGQGPGGMRPLSSTLWFINFISCLQHMRIPPWTVTWGLGVLAKQVVETTHVQSPCESTAGHSVASKGAFSRRTLHIACM